MALTLVLLHFLLCSRLPAVVADSLHTCVLGTSPVKISLEPASFQGWTCEPKEADNFYNP